MQTTLLMTVEHSKPIPHLWDLAAGRAYTIDGVTNVVPAEPTKIEPERLVVASLTLELSKMTDVQLWALRMLFRAELPDASPPTPEQLQAMRLLGLVEGQAVKHSLQP